LNLFIHAAPVSLTATEKALNRLKEVPPSRQALVAGLVDPSATSFAQDDAAYARLRQGVAPHLDGVERVILSCSAYNAFAPRLQTDLGLPVERSDDAGVWAVLGCGKRIGLAVTYPPSYSIIADHLGAVAAELGLNPVIVPLLSGNAFAFAGEDPSRYAQVLIEAVRGAPDADAVFLSQFSMDPYAARTAEQTQVPVVSALEACLQRLVAPAVRQ
jgi:Asp/Glu/hydantoin racemase